MKAFTVVTVMVIIHAASEAKRGVTLEFASLDDPGHYVRTSMEASPQGEDQMISWRFSRRSRPGLARREREGGEC